MATNVKKTAEKPANEGKTYTKDELDAIVKKAVEDALKSMQTEHNSDDKIVVNREEMLTIYFFGVVAPGTSVQFGNIGTIPSAGTPIDISKKDFFKGMSLPVQRLLESRIVIVAAGLTADERKRYGLDYKDGEVLTQDEFFDILNYGAKKLAERYEKLCPQHKKIVVDLFADDLFEKGGTKTTAEKVKAMRKASQKDAQELLPLIGIMLDELGKRAMQDD